MSLPSYLTMLFLLVLTAVSTSALAAEKVIRDPGQQLLEEQARERQQQELQAPPTTIETPKRLDMPLSSKSDTCMPIERIVLKDATLIPMSTQQKIFAPYLKQCMTVGDIKAVVVAITNSYIDRGLITSRIAVPLQDLSKGTLELVAMEGRIESVSLKGKTGYVGQLATAVPFAQGKILQLRDLEQGMEQINRMPSSNAQLRLMPGDAKDTTKVLIEDTPGSRFRFNAGYDNFGQEVTGKHRARLSAERDNLFGVNDMLALFLVRSERTKSLAGSGSVPFGYWTFSVDGSYSDYTSPIGESQTLLGESTAVNTSIKRLIYRDKSSKVSLSGSVALKDSSRVIGDVVLEPQPLTVASGTIDYFLRTEGGTIMGASLTYAKGLEVLGAKSDAPDLSSEAAHAQFDKIAGTFMLSSRVKNTVISSQALAQYAFQPLYGSELIAMGDQGSVRGFTGSPVAGDSGAYLRNDVMPGDLALDLRSAPHYPALLSTYGFHTLQPYAFADAGFAKLKAENNYQKVAGGGLGLRLMGARVSADLSVATPFYASNGIREQGTEVYLSVSMKLY